MNTKEKIVEAGIYLFNTNGFAATSIRDIAKKAKVNSANISYYFQGKNGLLEYCLITYFEQYLQILESHLNTVKKINKIDLIIHDIMYFQFQNRQLSRLVLREMSLDNQMVREIMATYLMKEKYIFQKIFQMVNSSYKENGQTLRLEMLLVEFKGLMSAPFLNPHYMTEVLYIYPSDYHFLLSYCEDIIKWLKSRMQLEMNQLQLIP